MRIESEKKLTPLQEIVAQSLIFIISMVWFWRKFNFKILPGDNGDSRLCMMWMENWYHSVVHLQAPWNIPNFFPIKNTLSGSDAFFLEGITHTLFRIVGFSPAAAFSSSILFLHVIGCFSVIFLVRILNFRFLAGSIVVILYGTMTPFWLSRNHVQLLLMPILGWIVYFAVKASKGRHKSKNLTYASMIFWSLVLSSGYAIAFGAYYLFIGVLLSPFIFKFTKKT